MWDYLLSSSCARCTSRSVVYSISLKHLQWGGPLRVRLIRCWDNVLNYFLKESGKNCSTGTVNISPDPSPLPLDLPLLMLAGIKHWPCVYILQHSYFYNFPLQSTSVQEQIQLALLEYLITKISLSENLQVHTSPTLPTGGTGNSWGWRDCQAQKRREEIPRGVLQVCKINKRKEKARIQHSIGHLQFPKTISVL